VRFLPKRTGELGKHSRIESYTAKEGYRNGNEKEDCDKESCCEEDREKGRRKKDRQEVRREEDCP
jgi:hypothetical protein